jgi:hypothetical protein
MIDRSIGTTGTTTTTTEFTSEPPDGETSGVPEAFLPILEFWLVSLLLTISALGVNKKRNF